MSTRLSLEDLPPRYRAQAEAQIARCTRGKCTPAQQTLADAAKSAGKIGRTFESRGEYEYYISVVVPGIESAGSSRQRRTLPFHCCPQRSMAMSNCQRRDTRQTMCWCMLMARWKW